MATTNLVIDTSIFIEHLRAKDKRATILYSLPEDSSLFLSAVTLYELYMGATSADKLRDIQLLTDDLTVLPFTDDVAKEPASIFHELKKTNQLIEFRDIFIAATCLVYKFPLKTTNTKHFGRISGIELY